MREARTAGIAQVHDVGGRTVVYAAAAAEVSDGSRSEITVDCTADAPAYFLIPSVINPYLSCWLTDVDSGARYGASNPTSSLFNISAATAAGVFNVPTAHNYEVCMATSVNGVGSPAQAIGQTVCDDLRLGGGPLSASVETAR